MAHVPPTRGLLVLLALLAGCLVATSRGDQPSNARKPAGDAELRYWLQNMADHRFTPEEMSATTGLEADAIEKTLTRFKIRARKPANAAGPLRVLPYPGGRHPRIGFLDGAVDPQRETKISVFAPWDPASYAVVDVPEAIWSNLGLTYLAHTHVPTIWTKQKIELPRLEWNRRPDGTLDIERKLPNGIVFASRIEPAQEGVAMELTLTNGAKEKLTDLRVQNCVMLKGMKGFTQQNNDNKVFKGPYAACKSADGKRWVITAWEPLHRGWANPRCPCLHADPKFPDCPPGETVRVTGWLSFYEGDDLEKELARLDKLRAAKKTVEVKGSIVDADTGKPIAARVYVRDAKGRWLHVRSADPKGSAVRYDKNRSPTSVEIHTTISAHPFVFDARPGDYTVIVERGKEYRTLEKKIEAADKPVDLELKPQRWIDLAGLGWYSGDTHVHRTLEELPNVVEAEDLNVALPLLHWVTQGYTSPQKNPKSKEMDPGRLIEVDKTHVIWPRNTEYEIFTVNGKRHTLGAFFVLGHKQLFDEGVPPVGPIAEQAHKQGALLELDKHNWPWSMMLVPVMKIDLFELTNNHVWRTNFFFRGFGAAAADYMKIETDDKGFTEKGWLEFGFHNYYALLNSGFRLRPTAGTAGGVHPVPLGWGRVYVHLPAGFSYEKWMKGLNAGRTFVTTGPMLFVRVNDAEAGHTFKQANATPTAYRVKGQARSDKPLDRIEIVVNGAVAKSIKPANKKEGAGFASPIDVELKVESTSWLAVRAFEKQPDGRLRFAHTSPVWIDVTGRPLRPRRQEIEYLIQRVQDELTRNEKTLNKESVAEYRKALEIYRKIAKEARP